MNRRTICHITYFLFSIFLISCKSSAFYHKSHCNSSDFHGYKELTYDYFQSSTVNTSKINTIKFHCPASSFSLKKVLYDQFGNWDESRYVEGDRHPVLVWNDVKLFDGSKLYHVASYGEENDTAYYTSVMVFDENWNDVLVEESSLRQKITEYFSKMLREEKQENNVFYSKYWYEVNSNEVLKKDI